MQNAYAESPHAATGWRGPEVAPGNTAGPRVAADPIDAQSLAGGWPAAVARWAGAGISLALVTTLVVWGYRTAVRDPSQVPVIRAMDGPMRSQPEIAGGTEAAHQGLEVSRVLEGAPEAGEAEATLAPPPADLTDEDLPQADLLPDAAAGGAANGAVVPGQMVAPGGASEAGGPALRPRSRPSDLTAPGGVPAGGAPAGQGLAGQDLAGQDLAGQGAAIQLGSFASAEAAETEWAVLSIQNADLLGARDYVIEEAALGSESTWRLRVSGFADALESEAFCEALKARGAACAAVP
jgi:hypothetical protein